MSPSLAAELPFKLFILQACEPSGFPELPTIVATWSQWGTMDAAAAQQLATAIQALVAAAAVLPPPPAPPAPAAPAAVHMREVPLLSPLGTGQASSVMELLLSPPSS